MDAHKAAVAAIEDQIRHFSEVQKPFRIYHGSTNSTRDSRRRLDNAIDTSRLNRILEVDRTRKTAIVEPNVPMDVLLRSTLEHGLVPLVVMEFPGITAGGGFSGTSGESSSFRHGFFDGTVNWVEIVLAKGETVKASRTELPDLFWGAASSFGTLGVVTLLEVRLRESTNFVELTYYPSSNMPDAMERMELETKKPDIDYLDGIVYSKDQIITCSGRLTNRIPPKERSQHFTHRSDPWFYIHVQRRMKGVSEPVTEYMPLVDYLFRYDRGGFWVARYAFKYFVTPFNRVTRFILDRFMHTRVMYHALHASGQSKMYIIQDVAIPYKNASNFHEWLDKNLKIYPIWLCPLRQRRDGPDAQHGLYADLADAKTPEFMMNFGVWGPGPKDRKKFLEQNRLLEHKVDELGGRKWLYAQAYYTEEEFWTIYDREAYEALRQKYGASYLPNVYDKVKVDIAAEEEARKRSWLVRSSQCFWGIWPLSGLYGVYKAWRGGEYLLQKDSMSSIQKMKEQ